MVMFSPQLIPHPNGLAIPNIPVITFLKQSPGTPDTTPQIARIMANKRIQKIPPQVIFFFEDSRNGSIRVGKNFLALFPQHGKIETKKIEKAHSSLLLTPY